MNTENVLADGHIEGTKGYLFGTPGESTIKDKSAKEPRVFWSAVVKIVYEFQVFYLVKFPDGHEELRSIQVRGETPEQVGWHLAKAGLKVTSVGMGIPIVDCSKPFLSRNEVEYAACIGATALSDAIGSGELKKSGNVYSLKAVEAWREKS